MSESIPLEQGLRQVVQFLYFLQSRSESIPLEQGLRLEASDALIFVKMSECIPLNQENEYTNQQNTQWQPFPTRKQNHCVFLFVHLRTDSQMLKNDLRKMKNQQKAVNEALNEKCMF